jgi:hypothetical protein
MLQPLLVDLVSEAGLSFVNLRCPQTLVRFFQSDAFAALTLMFRMLAGVQIPDFAYFA